MKHIENFTWTVSHISLLLTGRVKINTVRVQAEEGTRRVRCKQKSKEREKGKEIKMEGEVNVLDKI